MVLIEHGRASFGQEQLWLAEQLTPGTAIHHSLRAFEVHGPLDLDALQWSVDQLVVRHEALRTTLHLDDAGLSQRIQPPTAVDWTVLGAGISYPSVAAATADLMPYLRKPFDLARDLMVRAYLARLGADRHLLVFNVHHSACDGISLHIMLTELAALYPARRQGVVADLAPPGARYLEHSESERDRWAGVGEVTARTWLDSLRRVPRRLDGVLFTHRAALVSAAGTRHHAVPAEAIERLRTRSGESGVTPNMMLVALFAILLSKWTGETRPTFVTPVGTRIDPAHERTVGFFVNSLPVTLDLSDNPTLGDLLGQTRDHVIAMLERAQTAPAAIQAAMAGPDRQSGPLHQVSFAWEPAPPERFRVGELRFIQHPVHPMLTEYGLSVRIELHDGARLVGEYDTSVLAASTVDRFVEHFRDLWDAADDHRRVKDFPSAPSRDLARLAAWSRGPDVDIRATVLDRIASHVRRSPDAVAVRDHAESLTYRELWDLAGTMASDLRAAGLGPGGIAGVVMPRNARLLVAILAALRCHAAFLPLDPRDPPGRRNEMLSRCAADVIVATDEGGRVVVVPGPGRPAEADRPTIPHSLAYIMHTSGSTGAPKGVLVTHRGLANYLDWAAGRYGLGPGVTVPLHTSIAFDLAMTSLLGPPYAGATVHVLDEKAGPLAVARQTAERYQMVKGTPSHLLAVLDAIPAEQRTKAPRVLVVGGDNWAAGHARAWREMLPQTMLVNEYGPTETVVGSTAYEVGDDPTTEDLAGGTVPIGTPIANTTVHVVNRDLDRVPIGVRGELLIGGAGVALGYHAAPGLTAARFVPDPFDSIGGGRLYRTGDLALWNDHGCLELVGRIDNQIKVLGYRVEPAEVESVLAGCSLVRQAAVVADRREDQPVRLVGYAVPAQNTAPDEAWLAGVDSYVRARLPAHMVPDTVVALDRLPVNANGKVDRARLPMPVPRSAATPAVEGPGHWHRIVHAVWSEVLGVERIPVDVGFFEIGGTSLMLLRVDAALRARGASGLTVTDLFRFTTINDLAGRLSGAADDTTVRPSARADQMTARRDRRQRLRDRHSVVATSDPE